MSTLRKLVSDIRSMHKLISTDALATDRMIASEIRNSAMRLLKQESNLRKLWATDTIFQTLPCLEMKEVSIAECCDYTDECTIARSVYKIPRIAEGNYQYIIQGVYSINALGGKGKKIIETTVNRYINSLKLPLIKNQEYFFITNDYLYVTNPLVEKVRLVALFTEDVPNEILYSDCDCGEFSSIDDICKNPLDKPFYLPPYLEEQALEMTSKKLLQRYFSVATDNTNQGIDDQSLNNIKR